MGEVAAEEEGEISMKKRLVIPTEDKEGNYLAAHFGRAPYFAAIDVIDDTVKKTVHPNRGEHAGGRGHAHDNVMSLNPDVIIVSGMGPRGIRSFQDRNVAVLRATTREISSILDAYKENKLDELTEGCADAHHR